MSKFLQIVHSIQGIQDNYETAQKLEKQTLAERSRSKVRKRPAKDVTIFHTIAQWKMAKYSCL